MLGDLHVIIPVDSLSISLGMGLSITLKAGVNDSRWLPWVFFSSSWLTNIDGMKDLWYSTTVQLLSTQI